MLSVITQNNVCEQKERQQFIITYQSNKLSKMAQSYHKLILSFKVH